MSNISTYISILNILCKKFFGKDLFTKRRPTVGFSNRVMDCKIFFVYPNGGWQKRTGLFLLALYRPKQWACCCYCGVGRVKGFFLEVGEESKISYSFFNNQS